VILEKDFVQIFSLEYLSEKNTEIGNIDDEISINTRLLLGFEETKNDDSSHQETPHLFTADTTDTESLRFSKHSSDMTLQIEPNKLDHFLGDIRQALTSNFKERVAAVANELQTTLLVRNVDKKD